MGHAHILKLHWPPACQLVDILFRPPTLNARDSVRAQAAACCFPLPSFCLIPVTLLCPIPSGGSPVEALSRLCELGEAEQPREPRAVIVAPQSQGANIALEHGSRAGPRRRHRPHHRPC